MMTRHKLAPYIDHTLLKPEATPAEIEKICKEAKTYEFIAICVNGGHVPLARQILQGSSVKIATVVGFPLGACTATTKAFETQEAVRNGADEIDMVMAIGLAKAGLWAAVEADIRAVVVAAGKAPVKVILETSLLNDQEKELACRASVAAGAAFVKTSTGFGGGGATLEDIKLMRRIVGPALGVKASGGVRTAEAAEALIQAGATRLGTSQGVALVTGGSTGNGY